jgi:hypothetical protein
MLAKFPSAHLDEADLAQVTTRAMNQRPPGVQAVHGAVGGDAGDDNLVKSCVAGRVRFRIPPLGCRREQREYDRQYDLGKGPAKPATTLVSGFSCAAPSN